MAENPQTSAPELPSLQECRKCGAAFRWEPSNPGSKTSPLVARLVKPSDSCDCGYGTIAPTKPADS